MSKDDDNVRGGEPPRRKSRGESRERPVSRADRMEKRRNRYRSYDEMPVTELRAIALYQKVLILCILALLILYASAGVLQAMTQNRPPNVPVVIMQVCVGLSIVATAIASTVFVFLLATKTYNVAVGVVLGILTLLPCFGLIVLLIINSQATSLLRRNGVHVGFIGARKRDLDDLESVDDDEDDEDGEYERRR